MVTIEELIRKFRLQQDSYCRAEYNEAQLRREFLDDMIRLWGWDIGNTEVLPETFKEVVVEDKIQMNGRAKSPDYALQLVEKKLLFIEAKKPAINIKESKDSAFQVRSYAWTATHPLCVLTNFAEFAVYDTTIPPLPNDRADTSRIFYCTFEEYLAPCKSYPDFPTHWDFITGLFGKNAVLKGSLAQFRQPGKSKGTALVDEMFLRDIESWRTILAENIALRNKISERELNFAVQATIDRIVFLRICEGRGIEKHGRIEKAAKGKNVYNALFNLFYEADVRYDSGLFYFSTESGRSGQPDSVTPKLKIDDSPLKKIVAQLYFPAPYAFEEISADILGSVYERFLGKTIRLESKHQIKIEEKPEIRKAGGVYYTPVYIVDYIVDNTVGAFLKTQTPQTVKKLRILDPACGSGSFLIVAYQFLLDWFLQQYKKNIKKYAKRLHKISATDYKLTIQERKRILTEHIFGVDIDAQAIEVSKLSLLLKVLEGQSDRELQKTLFNTERALPDLDANIRCGNTLVGTDYFSLLKSDEEEWLRVNPFDWQLEFKPVFDDGGFDVIIGNPPYGATLSPQEKTYMKNRYKDVHIRTPDKSNYYISQTLRLLKSGGYFSFILPNNLLFQNEYEKTRLLLLQQKIDRILNLGDGVFLQATVPTCILVAEKQSVNSYRFMFADLRGTKQSKTIKTVPGKQMIQAAQIFKTPSYVFGMTAKYFTVLKKILSKSLLIDEIAEEVASGIASGADKIFRVSETFAGKNKLERTLLKKVLIGREIDRYHIENTNHFII